MERKGATWFKIVFDEWLRYPERVEGDWYIHGNYVEVLFDEGNKELAAATTSDKYIIVDRSEQKLYAFNGNYTQKPQLYKTTCG